MPDPVTPAPTPTEAAVPETPKSAAVVTPAVVTPAPAKTAADLNAEAKAASEKSLLDKASDEAKDPKDKKEGTDTPPVPKVIPEKYELKAPEGMELDTNLVEAITPIAKKLNLSNEDLQELANVYAPHITKQIGDMEKARVDAEAKARQDAEAATIKELGARYQEDLSLAAKARDRFFSPASIEFINKAGLGSNAAFIRDCVKLGTLISEDPLVEGGEIPTGADASAMFPSMTNK